MYIYEVAKSYGFSFGTKKEKAKPKALASCADGNEKFPYYRTTLSPAVAINTEKFVFVSKIPKETCKMLSN